MLLCNTYSLKHNHIGRAPLLCNSSNELFCPWPAVTHELSVKSSPRSLLSLPIHHLTPRPLFALPFLSASFSLSFAQISHPIVFLLHPSQSKASPALFVVTSPPRLAIAQSPIVHASCLPSDLSSSSVLLCALYVIVSAIKMLLISPETASSFFAHFDRFEIKNC